MKATLEERVDIIEQYIGITEETIPGGDLPTLRQGQATAMQDHYALYERVCKLERERLQPALEPQTLSADELYEAAVGIANEIGKAMKWFMDDTTDKSTLVGFDKFLRHSYKARYALQVAIMNYRAMREEPPDKQETT